MAIGWFTVLKSVPWTTVISNAPVVADGAKKLWKAVASRNEATQTEEQAEPAGSTTPPAESLTAQQAQLTELQQAAERLEQQMLASSELINALAEQNAQLVELVEANRIRTLWLSRLSALLAVFAVFGLGLAIYGLTRP